MDERDGGGVGKNRGRKVRGLWKKGLVHSRKVRRSVKHAPGLI